MHLQKSCKNSANVLLFCALEFIYWSGNGMFYSFNVPFMNQKGLSNLQIGLILSINAFLLLLTLPLWGFVTDKLKSPKLVMGTMFAFSSVIMMLIPMLHSPMSIALGICLLAIFESGIASIVDSYIIQAISRIPGASYGSIRLWGSLGVASSLALSTGVVATLGTQFAFYYYSICLLILVPILRLLPAINQSTESKRKLPLKELLGNLKYLSFLLFAALLFIPYRFSVSFLVQIVEHAKGDTGDLSISLLSGYVSEIACYFLSIFLFRHFKLSRIIFISSIFFIFRQLAFSLVQSPYQVSLVQLTQGPTFTLLSASALLYIHSIAPDHLKSTAQAAGNAVLFGVSGIISNVLGGYLIDHIGITKTLQGGAVLSLLAVVAYAALTCFAKADQKQEQCIQANSP